MDTEVRDLFKQGAEGRVYKINHLGKSAILKERFKKTYRNSELDARLTKERIRAEAKSILRCKNAGIRTPAIYLVDFESRKIIMEYIENSQTVSEFINKCIAENDGGIDELKKLSAEMGRVIGKMHHSNIIHGDLTTSNILIQHRIDNSWLLFLIDFGLSYSKSSDEDKAVDLYVLERAMISKHSEVNWFFEDFLKHYVDSHKVNERVVKKFHEVRSRGRKRTMIG